MKVWTGIYSQHQHGEPSLASFMRQYGATMQRKLVDLPLLNACDIREAILRSKPTSAGMGGFMPVELKHLALWSPSHIDALTKLLRCIESSGVWPRAAVVGAVAFVPKDPKSIPNQTYLSGLGRVSSQAVGGTLATTLAASWHLRSSWWSCG